MNAMVEQLEQRCFLSATSILLGLTTDDLLTGGQVIPQQNFAGGIAGTLTTNATSANEPLGIYGGSMRITKVNGTDAGNTFTPTNTEIIIKTIGSRYQARIRGGTMDQTGGYMVHRGKATALKVILVGTTLSYGGV